MQSIVEMMAVHLHFSKIIANSAPVILLIKVKSGEFVLDIPQVLD